jgi:hypothetical protein
MPAMKVTDFTRLPIGTAVARGEVAVCPYCGKNGVKTKTNDIEYYTHEERVGFDSNGLLIVGWSACPTDEQVYESLRKKENPQSAESK